MTTNEPIESRNRSAREAVQEIDLLDLFGYYRQRILWIIAAFLIGALIAGGITHFVITPKYTATSKMYMVSSSSQSVVDLTDLNVGTSISSDYVELLKTRPLIEDVIQEQKLTYSYPELIDMLSLSVVADTRIVQINVTSTDKREAMNIANAIAEKGVKELPKLMETPAPHIAEYAIVPVNPSSPSLTKNTMIGALIFLFLMLAFCTLQYLMDDTFKTAEDIEREFGVMPLSVIPEGKIEGMDSAADMSRKELRELRKRNKRSGKKDEKYGRNQKQS